DADGPAFGEEAFVPVLVETALAADGVREFLQAAVRFCNECLAGDLAAVVRAPRAVLATAGAAVERALGELGHGTVGLNAWPALALAGMTAPWGAGPAGRSGAGRVHDALFLRGTVRTVVRGRSVPWPRPVWWPRHRDALGVVRDLLALTLRPSA